jgi:hypothetical protein
MRVPPVEEIVELMRRELVGHRIDGELPAIVVDSLDLCSSPQRWPARVDVRFTVADAPPRRWRWSHELDFLEVQQPEQVMAGIVRTVLREWQITHGRRPDAWRNVQPE